MEIWEIIVLSLLALFCIIAVFMVTGIEEKIRRKKHPVWFRHYDLALKNSLWAGTKFREKTEILDARRDMVQDMFFKGECTLDEYDNAMKIIEEERREAAKQFSRDKEALGILQDLADADAYAKEHNLKWGIIYE